MYQYMEVVECVHKHAYERERERVSVCVCVCVHARIHKLFMHDYLCIDCDIRKAKNKSHGTKTNLQCKSSTIISMVQQRDQINTYKRRALGIVWRKRSDKDADMDLFSIWCLNCS